MTAESFPPEPQHRRAILVLSRHDYARCRYEPDAAREMFATDELHVLQLSNSPSEAALPVVRNLIDAGLARPGALLIQSPYESDIYEDASIAAHRFALAKHMYFSAFCMHLGAKEVKVEQIDLSTLKGKASVNLKGVRHGVGVEGAANIEELESFRAQLQLHDVFKGGLPDFDAAESLLRRTNLLGDPSMRALFEMRRGKANELLTRQLTLSLSSEAKNRMNVIASLKVPAFVKLAVDHKRVLEENYDYSLVVNVRFGEVDAHVT